MSQEFVTVTPSILEEHLARILTFNESAVANGMRRLVPYITGDTVHHNRGESVADFPDIFIVCDFEVVRNSNHHFIVS